jgi:hypothetical protein
VCNPGQGDADIGLPSGLATGAMAVYGFEEASGTTVKDSIDTHDGTLLNGATRAPGRFGQGLKLDGVNDRVWIANRGRRRDRQGLRRGG